MKFQNIQIVKKEEFKNLLNQPVTLYDLRVDGHLGYSYSVNASARIPRTSFYRASKSGIEELANNPGCWYLDERDPNKSFRDFWRLRILG